MKFWGKTDPAGGTAYKPVLHHLLDVAAVAIRLQEINRARTVREALARSVSPEILTKISAYLAGLHDLGKFSRSFQAKRPDLWPTEALGPMGRYADNGHWRNTAIMLCANGLRDELAALFPNLEDGLTVLIGSVAGHHGRPPGSREVSRRPTEAAKNPQIGKPCLDAGLEAMRILRGLIAPEPVGALAELEQCQFWSWRLAGLTTLADWIGSDSGIFEFEDPGMPVENYWPLALERADRAIAEKGLHHIEPRTGISLAVLAPQITVPRPMQRMAEEVAVADGPQLVIIEDTTGSGKTEAALTLAGRMMAAGKGEGIYFALPTMATANAMYNRLGDIHHRLFTDGANPSLVLAHGKASLESAFLASRARALNGTQDEEDTAAYCAEWIADNRRKAFFANVGAGTIDQAFLAVLKKKFLTLRQQGLAGRILIVDEAHAFDAYMSRELETLLEAHAALGGSAIILSATLSSAKRREIVRAYRSGLGEAEFPEPSEDHYPLLTSANKEHLKAHLVDFCEHLRREVAVERLPDAAAAQTQALCAAREGAAVLLIRNAVDEAIASYEALSAAHADTHLFHARFAMCDRQRIEHEVLARFGRDAEPEARAGHILVATEVVEQSLDLDFDLVISDLAPVDLIIQRAGRLWRHMDKCRAGERPISGPRILIIAPDPAEATHETWLEPVLGAGAFVYRHPGVMYRSAAALFSAGAIKTPDSLRTLMAQVYERDDVPECLVRGQNEAEGQRYGHRTHAGTNLINFAAGYTELGELPSDQEVGTRLGEDVVTLRLARRVEDKLIPWAVGAAEAGKIVPADRDAWAFSEVSVRQKWLGDVRLPGELQVMIAAAREGWPEWDQAEITVVGENGQILIDREEVKLQYNPQMGLLKLK